MNLKRTAIYSAAKQLAVASAHGTLFLLTGGLRNGITAVLMYHSIEVDLPWAVPAAAFRRQMLYLKANFRVVPLRQLRTECLRRPGAGRIISVTFDDGRLDNYVHALPVLEETGVKATFFVTTGYIGGFFEANPYQTPMMNERHLRELASLGHEVGAHTVTHPALTRVPRPMAYSEMADSKRRLEDLLGMPVESMAYPHGDCNREVRDCAAEIGFTCAGAVRNALITLQSDWLVLPRVGIDGTLGSGLYFKAKASHAVEVYERLGGTFSRLREYQPAPRDSDGSNR
jgi:peptidoglycan/xylan/chitin deacetylase (PgdA/CDA1 family)